MRHNFIRISFAWIILQALTVSSGVAGAVAPRQWNVDGVTREALVAVPAEAKTKPSPVIFVFHGHGGTMERMEKRYGLDKLWPEAIVVYPQGLNTPGKLTDPLGKFPGWQHSAGIEGDRDLRFFDVMLDDLKKSYQVDDRRIYATGHSNGGGFTYLLWAMRGDVFAAVAPTAAALTPALVSKLKPKPAMHLAGKNDPLVKFAWQEATMNKIREINQCGEGQPWGEFCTLYPSKVGAPVLTYIHPGTHNFPDGAEEVIVKFFQGQVKAP